jgi:hypothetical protein
MSTFPAGEENDQCDEKPPERGKEQNAVPGKMGEHV